MLLFGHTNIVCVLDEGKETFWKILEDERTGAWAEVDSNKFRFAYCEITFFVPKFAPGLPSCPKKKV